MLWRYVEAAPNFALRFFTALTTTSRTEKRKLIKMTVLYPLTKILLPSDGSAGAKTLRVWRHPWWRVGLPCSN